MRSYFHGAVGDRRMHTILLFVWAAITVASVLFGWIYLIAFISVCSLYANIATHWGGRQAAMAAVMIENK